MHDLFFLLSPGLAAPLLKRRAGEGWEVAVGRAAAWEGWEVRGAAGGKLPPAGVVVEVAAIRVSGF